MTNILSPVGKDEILGRLANLNATSAPKWGSMNVNQMLAHMNDAFKIALGMKAAVDTSTWFDRKVKFNVAVYVLPAWPRGEKTSPELDQTVNGTIARDYYTELEYLRKMLDIFEEREAAKFKPHPLFGPLTKQQWADLLYKHLRHHLRQFGV